MVAVDTLVTLLVLAMVVPVLLFGAAAGYATARLFGLPAQLRVYGESLGVGRWAAALPVTVALAVVFAVTVVGDIPSETDPGSTLADAVMALLLVGAVACSVGLGNLRRYSRVRTTTDAIDVTGGWVTISGTAETASDGPVTAPLSGEPCLAWAVRVREYRGLDTRGIRGLTRTDHGGVRFAVHDATGRVHVDPGAVALRDWSLPPRCGDFRAEARDGLPDRVAAYRDAHDLGDGDRRVYEELLLTAGETVTATGRIETADGVTTLAGEGRLAREPAAELRRSLTRRAAVGAGGVVAMVVGAVVLAVTAGLV